MVESIRVAREALRGGETVCVLPEGRITKTGEMGEFQRGFMSILKGTAAPVVPVFLAGLWGSVFSYEGGKVSTGVVRLDKEIAIDIKGKNVLVVDDILDTGRTLGFVKHYLEKFEPNEIKICVLVNKEVERAIEVDADYWGFKIPNFFIVGYGMDFENTYRHLPYIGILKR